MSNNSLDGSRSTANTINYPAPRPRRDESQFICIGYGLCERWKCKCAFVNNMALEHCQFCGGNKSEGQILPAE